MNFTLVALNPEKGSTKAIEITEWLWRPVRSIMAIANHLLGEKYGGLPVEYDLMEDLDYNAGDYIQEGDICKQLAQEMKNLANDPSILEEYGMAVEMEDGAFVFTYPVDMCVSAIEHRGTGEVISNPEDFKKEQLRSCFRVKEKDLRGIINFFDTCGGFGMP